MHRPLSIQRVFRVTLIQECCVLLLENDNAYGSFQGDLTAGSRLHVVFKKVFLFFLCLLLPRDTIIRRNAFCCMIKNTELNFLTAFTNIIEMGDVTILIGG